MKHDNPLYRHLSPADIDLDAARPWLRRRTKQDKHSASVIVMEEVVLDLDLWLAKAAPHAITPAMTSDEFQSLKLSIREHGLQDKDVFMNRHGDILDGYHRTRGVHELRSEGHDVGLPSIRLMAFNDEQGENLFVTLKNLTRRHLTLAQRRTSAQRLLQAGHDGTDNHIADLCGLSGDTVKSLREKLESLLPEAGGIDALPVRKSKDGRKYVPKKAQDEDELEPSRQQQDTEIGVIDEQQVAAANGGEAPDGEELVNPAIFSKLAAEPEAIWSFMNNLMGLWWHQHHFLPCYSVEVYSLAKEAAMDVSILGAEGKQALDNMTRLLSAFDVQPISKHLIYRRKDKNGTMLFSLSPPSWSLLSEN
ncbi:hypothetical protein BH09SUM1_BH09SUM1_01220 [soil metagenome]